MIPSAAVPVQDPSGGLAGERMHLPDRQLARIVEGTAALCRGAMGEVEARAGGDDG